MCVACVCISYSVLCGSHSYSQVDLLLSTKAPQRKNIGLFNPNCGSCAKLIL